MNGVETEVKVASLDLTGQVGFVTGGGRGIGRAMALELARAGMAVAVVARTESELNETVSLVKEAGGRALAFPLSVADGPAVRQMVTAVEGQLGPVDLLVNNAGVVTPAGPTWEVDPDEWWRNLEINLRGAFLCAHAVLPSMVARRRGGIINVTSGAGLGAIPYGSAYGVSKTALIRFAENLAAETRDYGISVFALDPGTTRTAMTDYLYSSEAGQQWLPWFRKNFDEGMGVVSMQEVMRLFNFLVSGKADPLSGRFLSVFDDLNQLVTQAETIKQDALYTLRLRKLEQ
jgi:NAD(P)-dependent dehydrogenase (short-subunit alcohol dehydrogenase family)